MQNALCVPTIEHNLLLSLILNEAGIKCNDTPKIHVEDTGVGDHALYFVDIKFFTMLQLWEILSNFHSRITTPDEITQ